MKTRHPRSTPCLLFANAKGEIQEYEGLQMAGSSAGQFYRPALEDLIPLPEGSELFTLPGRLPVGIEEESGEPALLESDPYGGSGQVQAVAAFMSPAYTSLATAAYHTQDEQSPLLPLFAYTAVGWAQGRFWVSGFRSDQDQRQDAANFDQETITRKTRSKLQQSGHNRLIQHLGKCCLTYCCPAARNYFLQRWEAPLPSSPVCNASCAGCISLQPSGCCASTQDRIAFVPTPEELAEIGAGHLQIAPKAIVSFGQGCEGEPLLQADTLEKSIRLIRSQTSRGTINLNTNGSLPEAVERLALAGLDSIRISLNSARLKEHSRYYQPRGFSLEDVKESIRVMKRYQRHVSLNYFIFPGVTDDPDEYQALSELICDCGPDFIQLRNLNMDPEAYLRVLQHQASAPAMGIRNWLSRLKGEHPQVGLGYFNPQVRT
ncbi:radical SAM protein [Desulfogranum mediterraneum]|uniref:radical SAM protein n=1 Tax=Desulfogranum mediterraneum TaxID=160661 RepID=UPI000416C425|nr:radical SAM protein [Desulfogranum mediterraneum]